MRPGGGGDGRHVDAARLVDGDPQDGTGLLEVEQLEVLRGDEGLDDGSDTLGNAHGQDLLSVVGCCGWAWSSAGIGPRTAAIPKQKAWAGAHAFVELRTIANSEEYRPTPPRPSRERHPGVAHGPPRQRLAGEAVPVVQLRSAERPVGVGRAVSRSGRRRRWRRRRRRSTGSEPSGITRQRTVTLSLASSASPSVPSGAQGMRAQPVAAASTASAMVETSTVRLSRRSVASASRVGLGVVEGGGHGGGDAVERHRLLGAAHPADQGDHVLGQVAGADLEAHGHALELPVGGPAAEARSRPGRRARPARRRRVSSAASGAAAGR